ncbi:hypothetical protein MMC28_008673 [Mycoblastus sanguinarius]|nr:hypothetical protein [Mycoblastus sanguinarius]
MSHQIPPTPPTPPGVEGLGADFGRMHLDPHFVPFDNHRPIFDGPLPSLGHGRPLNNNGKGSTSYEGYTFTKLEAEGPNQKETWALVKKVPMPFGQSELKEQVSRQYKRGATASAAYDAPDMKGFKRKQIDRLIQERNKMEGGSGFKYILASIKLDQRRKGGRSETVSMKVILKRLIQEGAAQGTPMSFGGTHIPAIEIVDLTSEGDSDKSSHIGSKGTTPGFMAHSGYFPPQHGGLGGHGGHGGQHGGHIADDRFFPHHSPPHGFEQPFANPHSPHGGPHSPHEGPHSPHGGPHSPHGGPHSPHGGPHSPHGGPHSPHGFPEEAYDQGHGHGDNDKKPKAKKSKRPPIIEIHPPKSHKKGNVYSDSESPSDSEASSRGTDKTPDTPVSYESHEHRKEKKYHKDSYHRKSGSRDHGHREPRETIYRQHKRKEPAPRAPSPAPSHNSHKSGSRYRYEEVEVEPEVSSRRRRELPRRQLSYQREHPGQLQRAMGYDDDHHLDHDLRGIGRRPTVYRKKIEINPRPIDLFDGREDLAESARERRDREMARELEEELRMENQLRKERLEKDRIERERLEKLEKERLDRERLEKLEKERLDRDRYAEPRYAEPRYPEPRYQEPRYQEPRYPEPRYPEPRYPEPRYPEPRYPETRYPEPRYAEPRRRREGPRYRDERYRDDGY